MKKQKWMMMGVSAIACAALLAPGAFAKDKEEAGSTPPKFFTPGQAQTQLVGQAATTGADVKSPTGAAFLFPAESPNQKDK
ncbi:hypothetical protein [Brevibacillus sp. NRS-1366]|uniref:hypothetical protein n=1 Tax=Brevibacillus sp. NRS-1366 TaxID=3233899 RepID=UPI003D195DAB